ncbi:MAG TPA: hypothetical protein VMB23_03655, partial [Spirochaetia bacterium]|nr:hypothetical protein [Spirochaetia bacterium]
TASGSVDTSYVTNSRLAAWNTVLSQIAVYPSTAGANAGKVVGVGSGPFVGRLNSDGTNDGTLTDGFKSWWLTNYGSDTGLTYTAVRVLPTGEILLTAKDDQAYSWLVRLTTTGQLDASFNNGNPRNLPYNELPWDLEVYPATAINGKAGWIAVAGGDSAGNWAWASAFAPDGKSQDNRFGWPGTPNGWFSDIRAVGINAIGEVEFGGFLRSSSAVPFDTQPGIWAGVEVND